jgi:hypothetical protein
LMIISFHFWKRWHGNSVASVLCATYGLNMTLEEHSALERNSTWINIDVNYSFLLFPTLSSSKNKLCQIICFSLFWWRINSILRQRNKVLLLQYCIHNIRTIPSDCKSFSCQ